MKPKQTTLQAIPEPSLHDLVVTLLERMEKAESHIRSLEATNNHLMEWVGDLDRSTEKVRAYFEMSIEEFDELHGGKA